MAPMTTRRSPTNMFVHELIRARKSGNEDRLCTLLDMIFETKWKPRQCKWLIQALQSFFQDEQWLKFDEDMSEEAQAVLETDNEEARVRINRVLVFLGGEPQWVGGPPNPDWANREWVHHSWDDPQINLMNCAILLEAGGFPEVIYMLEEMCTEPEIYFSDMFPSRVLLDGMAFHADMLRGRVDEDESLDRIVELLESALENLDE